MGLRPAERTPHPASLQQHRLGVAKSSKFSSLAENTGFEVKNLPIFHVGNKFHLERGPSRAEHLWATPARGLLIYDPSKRQTPAGLVIGHLVPATETPCSVTTGQSVHLSHPAAPL